jgi:5-methyltetrahydropteroyltriglutamate--homocysteine methyltransferase
MPRIGPARALKWALEGFWAGTVSAQELDVVAASIWRNNWQAVANANAHLGFIPSNDFSLYDHVLDTAVMVGAIPMRFATGGLAADPERYVAMARGGNVDGKSVLSLDLTKWFDTNYHHLVHELDANSVFVPDATKVTRELSEADALGIHPTPVLLDPLTLALRIAPMRAGTLCRDRCQLLHVPSIPRPSSAPRARLRIYPRSRCSRSRSGALGWAARRPCPPRRST